MTDQTAYIISQSVAALIEALGMLADNQYQSAYPGHCRFWRMADFMDIIEKYGLDHSSAVEKLREGK